MIRPSLAVTCVSGFDRERDPRVSLLLWKFVPYALRDLHYLAAFACPLFEREKIRLEVAGVADVEVRSQGGTGVAVVTTNIIQLSTG